MLISELPGSSALPPPNTFKNKLFYLQEALFKSLQVSPAPENLCHWLEEGSFCLNSAQFSYGKRATQEWGFLESSLEVLTKALNDDKV